MAEQLATARSSMVPHRGPVTPDCPVECLLTGLSLNSSNLLSYAPRWGYCGVGEKR